MHDRLPPDGGPYTSEGVRQLHQRLVAAGFDFVPEYSGKWQKAAPADWPNRCGQWDPDVVEHGRYGPLLNTGLYLNGLIAVDFDIDDPALLGAAVDEAAASLGPPICRRYRATSPRCALLYRTSDDDGLKRAVNGPDGAIEIFSGARRKLTAFGQHVDKTTQRVARLCWDQVPGVIRKADLPDLSRAKAEQFLQEVCDLLGEDSTITAPTSGDRAAGDGRASDVADLRRALDFVPNEGQLHWNQWNRIGMALYAAFDGSDIGLAEFIHWTEKNPLSQHRAAKCVERWTRGYASSPPNMIGAGTLYRLAFANGFQRNATDMLLAKKARQQAWLKAQAKPII